MGKTLFLALLSILIWDMCLKICVSEKVSVSVSKIWVSKESLGKDLKKACLKILAFNISRDENFVVVLSTSLRIFS